MVKTKDNPTKKILNPTVWKQGWREIGGYRKYYRSKWEANYARYLQWAKENRIIVNWKHESKTFWFEGLKRGTVSYLPDFWVLRPNGNEEYHEVKGWLDSKSKTKIKRMKKYHPEVKLIVIQADWFKTANKVSKGLIHDWE